MSSTQSKHFFSNEDDLKELIDMFAGKGGLIIDSAGAITDNAKPENVVAMVAATHKFGMK